MQINLCGKIPLPKRFLSAKLLLAMKLTTFILFLSFLQVSAAVKAQRINLSEKNTPITVILNKIQQQSGFDIFYRKKLVKDARVSVQLKNASVDEALKAILDPQHLHFSLDDKLITISEPVVQTSSENLHLREGKITGIVVDEDGKPLPRASITILGKTNVKYTASTGGTFAINTLATDSALSVSYVGYKTKVVKLEPLKKDYRVVLVAIDAKLNEVVVTGIFDKPKESFTGAVTVITKEQLKMFGNRNLLKTIGNIDPAFVIEERNNYGSDPNILPNISIRGTSTIPADLNNIQGTNARNILNLPLFILDGFEITLQRVMDMNQNDVESVVILKDASSTAAYGARGANGVVVITSIKPVAGQLRVSYSAGINLEIPDFSSYNLLNSSEKLAVEKLGGLYSATDISSQNTLNELYNTNFKATIEGTNTNWAKVPTQTGVGQFHQIGLSGGDAQFRYILNGSYNQVTGAMKGSKRDNFNGGITIMYLMKKVRLTNNLSVGFNNSSNSTFGDFSLYTKMNPYWSPYDANGNAIQRYATFSDFQLNPAYNGSLSDFNKSKYTIVRNTTSFDWDITKALKWSNSVGYSRQVGGTDVFKSPSNLDFYQNTIASTKGSYSQDNSFQQGYQVRSNISYGTVFGKHSIYGGANAQITEDKQNGTSVLVTGFSNDTQTDISNGITYSGGRPSTSESTVRTAGLSTTLSYNYDSRFFVDGNYNLTGASSFGSNSRFGTFWSAGIGWTVSNEQFMKDFLPSINLMRLRYNYGVTGGLNFKAYQSLSTYQYDRTAQYRGLAGANVTAFGNPDLKWQNTYQASYGLDLGLFNNRLSLSANYYLRRTTNAVSTIYFSYSHGFESYAENFGQINNSGIDLNMSVFVIRDNERKMYWSVTGAVAHNKNVLVKLSDALKKASAAAAALNATDMTYYQYKEGQSTEELYVLQSPGVDAATGKVLYLAADGTLTTSPTGNLPKIAMGDGIPKIDARFSSMFRLGQFSINVGFAGRFGGKKVNYTLLNKVENAFLRINVDKRVTELRWTKPGDVTGFKSLTATDATYPNNRFVFTENTISLNNVNVNYSLPNKWVKKLNMQQISIGASMSDIFYTSSIEQERGTTYPYSLKPSFNLSCTF
jgi:TonB-linked SusC/RagA family outer membrane protein